MIEQNICPKKSVENRPIQLGNIFGSLFFSLYVYLFILGSTQVVDAIMKITTTKNIKINIGTRYNKNVCTEVGNI